MWINVKEELPKNGDFVMVCISKYNDIKYSYINLAYYESGKQTDDNYKNVESDIDLWYVTYWQPLPELPI